MILTNKAVLRAAVAQVKAMPGYEGQKVYTERQVQNLTRPCFFVQQIHTGQTKLMRSKYRRVYRIRITWLPKRDDPTPIASCEATGDALLAEFRLLHLDDFPARPEDVEYEVVEQELRFTMEVPVRADWPEPDEPDIQHLKINEHIRLKNERSE